MKKYLLSALWLILLGVSGFYAYTCWNSGAVSDNIEDIKTLCRLILSVFAAGFSFAAIIFNLIVSNTTSLLNMYKRELEKESIDKTESSSRIKVLESKIQVLEKALDEALKK